MFTLKLTKHLNFIDVCIKIINEKEKIQNREIKVITPFGSQIWNIIKLDNYTTMNRYEIYIVFETPNGVIQIYMYAYKYEFERYVSVEIDGHEIPEEKFIWYDIS